MQPETTYLSSQNSVADNLKIMADHDIFTTKKFEASLKNLRSQNFQDKSNVLKIVTLSILVFSSLTGYFISKQSGMKISLFCLFPLALYRTLKNKRLTLKQNLNEADKTLASIYNQILENFKKHIYFKENYLINLCNLKNLVKQDFDYLNTITTNYNYNRKNLENEETDEKLLMMRKEYSELRILAKRICMKKAPLLIPDKIWNKFKKLCWQLSYGRCFSKNPITFVELYKSDETTDDSFNFPIFKARAW